MQIVSLSGDIHLPSNRLWGDIEKGEKGHRHTSKNKVNSSGTTKPWSGL